MPLLHLPIPPEFWTLRLARVEMLDCKAKWCSRAFILTVGSRQSTGDQRTQLRPFLPPENQLLASAGEGLMARVSGACFGRWQPSSYRTLNGHIPSQATSLILKLWWCRVAMVGRLAKWRGDLGTCRDSPPRCDTRAAGLSSQPARPDDKSRMTLEAPGCFRCLPDRIGWRRHLHNCSHQRPDAGGQRHGQRTPKSNAYCAHRHSCAAGACGQPT